ncbi:MAG: exodeoxyribonuclease V subunit gamma [Deltaproteobacteria bacterium]|nr:exodeoxyribonuclease V subunit gamma [Deltaproteobacteria bacterium]
MNPCKEYWFDIVSERQVDFIVREEGVRYDTPEKLHLETGNPLLASMGQLGRDFLSLILEFDPQEHTLFEDPGTSSMLAMVQSNILNLRPRPSAEGGKITISQRDRSIQIHSCHSRLTRGLPPRTLWLWPQISSSMHHL